MGHDPPACEGVAPEILGITPLPDNRRTPLAAVRVRLGVVGVDWIAIGQAIGKPGNRLG